MPPHRDWTRHGVGRAMLWWPFVAFVLVAVFPALAVPCVMGSGACLAVVGLVGGAVFRRRRARRTRRAVAASPAAITKADNVIAPQGEEAAPTSTPPPDDDAEGDHPGTVQPSIPQPRAA